jgi:FkbM family methyltransferase
MRPKGWRKAIRKLLRRFYRLYYNIGKANCVTQQINGIEAEFMVQTPSEYNRLTGRLMNTNEPILSDLLDNVESNDIVWDVGAHVGRYSCFVGQLLEDGHLVAFEPFEKNVEHLKKNLDRNGIDGEVKPFGLAEQHTTISSPLTHDESGIFVSSASNAERIEDGKDTVEIEVVPGDELVGEDRVSEPDVLRIDTSGGEPRVIEGLKQTLIAEACRRIYVVAYRHRYEDPEIIESLLVSLGFDHYLIDTPGDTDIIVGHR